MRIGIVGCGRIGTRRAEVIRRRGIDDTVVVADADPGRADALAQTLGCVARPEWQDVVASNVDVVIVATTNDWLAPVALAAVEAGRHVLVEKPMARSLDEAEELWKAAVRSGVVLKVGFNHRHHPAVQRAYDLIQAGAIGQLLFARCRYGHGGRPGYDREWRMDPQVSGGGELLDQGIHAIDLFRWFFGEFSEAVGFTASYIWGGSVEDNAFAILRTAGGQIASLHASWTQWKNLFSLELFGDRGYLLAEGLGGSYGAERLMVGRRRPEGGVPKEDVLTFASGDESWVEEWRLFTEAIRDGRQPPGNGYDGVQALRLIRSLYDSARTRKVMRL